MTLRPRTVTNAFVEPFCPTHGIWPRWKHTPDVGTIVHILAMGHLTYASHDDFTPLAGGFFAEVAETSKFYGVSEGEVHILTTPVSVTTMTTYDDATRGPWDWESSFPFHLRGTCHDNGMRFEIVPDEVQDAVRAFVELHRSTSGDSLMPIVVPDGWLC